MHTRKSSDEVPHCSLISSFEQKLNFIAAGKYDELLSKMLLSLKSKYLNGSARFKNVSNCLNTNIYSYLETSGGQSSNPYLNVVHFFNTRVN